MLSVTLAVASAPASGPAGGPAPQTPQAVQAPQAARPAIPAPGRQTAAPSAAKDMLAEAYYQFLLGRHFDADGDTEAAIKAYRRALELDPSASQVTSELSEVYARSGQMGAAIDLANAALKLDANNWDAHRILGMVYAEQAPRETRPAVGGAGPSAPELAIKHLELALGDTRNDVASPVRMTLARVYVSQRAFDKAVVVLKQVLADNPWLPQAVAMLAQAYSASGKTADAVALLKDAVEEEPSFYSALGDAYDKQRLYAEAAAAYGQASAQDPRDTDLKTKWAMALLNVGEEATEKRARDLLVEITTASPTAAWPLYLLSRAERDLGDLDAAEQAARRILAISATSASGAHALAQVLEARRQYSQLIEALEPVAAKQPAGRDAETALLLTHLGVSYLETGRSADAVSAFERASKLNPSDDALKPYLAQALVAAKQYDRALTLVREQRAARPDDVRLARMEADALRGQGKFDAGAAVLRTLADSAGAGSIGVQSLSEYFASEHRYADAAAILKAAQARFPGDLALQFQYGAMLDRLKRFDEAERVFRTVIAAEPSFAPALNFLGYTLVERGERLAEALGYIQRAVKLDPHNGAYLDSLGWAHFKLKQIDLAVPPLRTAAAQLVNDSVVQDHYGDVLAAQGRFADAVKAWRQSLAGDGEQIDRPKIERKIRDAQPRIGKE